MLHQTDILNIHTNIEYSPNSTTATEIHLSHANGLMKSDLAYIAADTVMNKSKVPSWSFYSNRGRQTKNKQENL